MARKASGKKAWGFSDRSGRRYRLKEMRTEWTGVKVGPDEFEEKHPQLTRRSHGGDAEALNDPRPPIEQENIKLEILGFDTVNLNYREPVTATGQVGRVTVGGDATPAEYVYFNIFGFFITAPVTNNLIAAPNTFFPEGFEATMSLGVISTESTEVNITGVSATGYPKIGNLQVAFSVPGQVTVAGFGITTNQGTLTITPSVVHTPTGVSGTVGQGTIGVNSEINISPEITGVQAETSNRTLIPYRDIEDDTDNNYLIAGQSSNYIHTWTGQTGVLQGNSASGFEVASFGRGYENASGTNVNTVAYPSTRLYNGMPEISFRITNKTGANISLNNNTRCEIEWTLGENQDGDSDAAQHKSEIRWLWPNGVNDTYLSTSYGLRSYSVVDRDSGGPSVFGDEFNDGDAGDYTTAVPSSVNVSQFPINWEDDKHTYLHVRLDALSSPSYTSPADSMINLPVTITRMTVMFDDPAANWTSTTPASQGFRVDFNTPPNGGVGTTTVDITNPLILTGVEGVATINDPWDERTTNGQRGIGFDSLSGYSLSDYTALRWGTSNTVDRYSWYVAVSSEQSYTISASGSSQYTVVSNQSNTTYYNPEIHHHKGNLYSYDVSDSSMASHPLYLSPWANSANSSYRDHGVDYNNDLIGSNVDYHESYAVVDPSGISSDGSVFSVNDSGYLVSAVNNSRIDANHYGSAGAKIECRSAHRDDTNQKWRIGLRTMFMSCRFHSAMNITIHQFPYCEWPERASVPDDTTHWESQTPNLLETDYTYNDGLYGGAAQNNWQYRPDTWRRDDLEAFRGEGSQA